MRNLSLISLLTIICLLFSGCSANKETISSFEQSINKIESAVETSEDWKGAEKEAKKLVKTYNDSLWKLQLLGDENEYEALKEDINILLAAIKAKDKTQTLTYLAAIKSNVTSIFKGNELINK